ncbi:MAG: iron-containing alcohol dehydrogenase [Bacillota bacterium]
MWEEKININKVFELRCKNTTYFGVGAIEKINDILDEFQEKGIERILFVTGNSSYKKCGAWEVVEPALKERNMEYEVYNNIAPNPTVEMIDEAAARGKKLKAQAVVGIGGGSPIDTAKGVAVLLENEGITGQQLYEGEGNPDNALPIVAINTTHGTGTEVDRFAVATIPEKEYKPVIAFEYIYPEYAIDDPQLTTTLDRDQTIAVTVDAINHVTESATTQTKSPYSILTAKETIRLASKYLPAAVNDPDNLTARYYLMYAAAIAGISFDNGLLHYTHALEHPLSAVRGEVTHGLGLGALLPAVVETIYPSCPEVLADIYSPIVPDLEGIPGEAEYISEKIENWLFKIGCTEKLSDLGFKEEDVERLTALAKNTPSLDLLLSVAPDDDSAEIISSIYERSLERIN